MSKRYYVNLDGLFTSNDFGVCSLLRILLKLIAHVELACAFILLADW